MRRAFDVPTPADAVGPSFDGRARDGETPGSKPARGLKRRLHRVFHDTEEANRLAMLEALPRTCDGPMLDIGTHTGAVTMRIAERVGAREVHGVELIADHIPLARDRGIRVVHRDVDEGLPYPDGHFALVTANQVIEHVRRTDVFLSEIRRVLAPDGIACISTNNLSAWHNVVSLALGFQPTPIHVSDEVIVGNPLNPEQGWAHEDRGRTHLRLFTVRGLVELARHHGLIAVSHATVGYYPLPPRLARIATRLDGRHGAFVIGIFRPGQPAPDPTRPGLPAAPTELSEPFPHHANGNGNGNGHVPGDLSRWSVPPR